MKKLKFCSVVFVVIFVISGKAQPPDGYYDSAAGLTGEDLRTELYNIIKGHNSQSYDDLWTHFNATDTKSGSIIWDIYSDVPGGTPSYTFTYSSDQCGNYSGEGDCYNREHSVPQDWFGGSSPAYSDLFHVYPTDGYTNGRRSNNPYGEVGSASWTSSNGSKVGSSNYPGYSGTVFEPIDEYKGDIARTYFYMVTRYKNDVSGWSGDMFQSDDLSSWALDMLMDWAEADTVSQKEIDRNEAIYQIQGNRNPYIDRPYYVDHVWTFVNGVEEKEQNPEWKIWYTKQQVYVENVKQAAGFQLTITDIMGREIAVYSEAKKQYALNVSPGVYFVTSENANHRQVTKIVVN